jgi:hypothetical protein
VGSQGQEDLAGSLGVGEGSMVLGHGDVEVAGQSREAVLPEQGHEQDG